MPDYTVPGVYVEEVSIFPFSVHPLSTSKPVFIGYTEKGPKQLTGIFSLTDFEELFGGPYIDLPAFVVDGNSVSTLNSAPIPESPVFHLYYSLKLYFANGGGPCYVLSAGRFGKTYNSRKFKKAIRKLQDQKGPSLIVLTDLGGFEDPHEYYSVYEEALDVCQKIGNCFTIIDTKFSESNPNDHQANIQELRSHLGGPHLRYGAAYYPQLVSYLEHHYSEDQVTVIFGEEKMVLRHSDQTIEDDPEKKTESFYHNDDDRKLNYHAIVNQLNSVHLVLPPSGAVAGVYAYIDINRGVWKAPAGVELNDIERPIINISSAEQELMNVSPDGKSVNVIRKLTGRGTQIWGARTLAGNDNEWRYISVQRLIGMIKGSVEASAQRFVFEPNDANTWNSAKGMIENFLLGLWRNGAIQGAKQEQAFFVKVGLGETMTQVDIQEGRIIIELGVAAVRPAEFIVIRISLEMSDP
ncbi:phage tail sheath family protein [Rhodohalobacter sp. 614A]|uniref:phage tail sheath family protein n=1 Tax=Rhodohalobacter sp. 614A TaxID=2908649 RepID=UPI001F3F4E0B|nr:phage tail sheath C-terminal domain-containing protein [Rhodohalobacter sp. 614A]